MSESWGWIRYDNSAYKANTHALYINIKCLFSIVFLVNLENTCLAVQYNTVDPCLSEPQSSENPDYSQWQIFIIMLHILLKLAPA